MKPPTRTEEPPPDWVLTQARITARAEARRIGASEADADDVAQAVIITIWMRWTEPHLRRAYRRGPAYWRNYLRVAARNAAADIWRTDTRRRRREEKAASPAIRPRLPTRPGQARRPASASDATSEADEYLARLLIADAIDSYLTGELRTVAWLLFVEGWAPREISKHLGVSARKIRADRQKARMIIGPALIEGRRR